MLVPVGASAPLKEVAKTTVRSTAARLPRKGVVRTVLGGKAYTVMAMNLLKKEEAGYPLRFVIRMAKDGKAGVFRDTGEVMHLHHLARNPNGPLVIMRGGKHLWSNKRQHPRGVPGLSKRQRHVFERKHKPAFWRSQGRRILRERYEAGEITVAEVAKAIQNRRGRLSPSTRAARNLLGI